MASNSLGLALPEPLKDEDARSWFKRFEVCSAADDWNDQKKLLRLPTLLRGRAWAIFDSLPDASTDSYANLKAALLERLSPDTDEDRISARNGLSQRRLAEDRESIDELARDIEKLLDRSSPGLPAEIRDAELRFHFINALPEKIALQLKLLPKVEYHKTISKARELLLIFRRAESSSDSVSQVQVVKDDCLDKLEEAVLQVSEQLANLSTRRSQDDRRCFKYGKLGHLARFCRSRRGTDVERFGCGARGHVKRNCPNSGNDQGGILRHQGAPGWN